jgi:hypothetical protein
MNVDTLSGRDLDAAVAQHVFGHVVEPRVNPLTAKRDYVQRTPSGRDWVQVGFYTASGGAAINVEQTLRDRGWRRTEPRERATGDVRVVLEHADGRTVEAFGPMNTAVCRAALKTVGQ